MPLGAGQRAPGDSLGHTSALTYEIKRSQGRVLSDSYTELLDLKVSNISTHTSYLRRQVRPDQQPREASHRKLELRVVALMEPPSTRHSWPTWAIGWSKLSYREQQGAAAPLPHHGA